MVAEKAQMTAEETEVWARQVVQIWKEAPLLLYLRESDPTLDEQFWKVQRRFFKDVTGKDLEDER
jgi:hypothetical protein